MKPYTRSELDRIIIGNQISIMRALAALSSQSHKSALIYRVETLKSEWRHRHNEEIGFESALGDRPRVEKT